MFTIGIAGGSGSGKTTLVNSILEMAPYDQISLLTQDAYYKDSSHLPVEQRKALNFDHPDSIEWELLVKDILKLQGESPIHIPTYSYLECIRLPETIYTEPKKILIVEGILIYTCPELRDLLDMKLFLEVPSDQRLTRIMRRDIKSRGRTVDMVIDRYYKVVRPMHEEFIEPSRNYADMLVMGGGKNQQAADFIASAILEKIG